MSNYRRAFVPGGCWFFTVNLLELRQAFLVEQIAPLRKAIALTRQALPFTIDAFVVLPDHIHAIWTLPPGDADFSTRWRLIKAGSRKRYRNANGSVPLGLRVTSAGYGNGASGNI
jgi:putative transposase